MIAIRSSPVKLLSEPSCEFTAPNAVAAVFIKNCGLAVPANFCSASVALSGVISPPCASFATSGTYALSSSEATKATNVFVLPKNTDPTNALGKSWKDTYMTSDKLEVEQYKKVDEESEDEDDELDSDYFSEE